MKRTESSRSRIDQIRNGDGIEQKRTGPKRIRIEMIRIAEESEGYDPKWRRVEKTGHESKWKNNGNEEKREVKIWSGEESKRIAKE